MKIYSFTIASALTLIACPLLAQNQTDYLALGDSVPYGFDPTVLSRPNPRPNMFVGYPEIVHDFLRRQIRTDINTSCPGETSGSFLNIAAPDNGCNHPHIEPGQPPVPAIKTSIGLHTPYTGSQVAFAVSQLTRNRSINLVTLSIGANDLLLVQLQCALAPNFPACVQGLLPSVLGAYGTNLAQILTAIRVQARYTGKLIVMTYYSPSADPLFIQAVAALNQVMFQVGGQFPNTQFADAFTAFRLASMFFQGDPCKAGLLVRLSATACDVHPSRIGQNVLAATVLVALAKN
jgi:lysophospholipase L1-like esterase